MKDTRAQFKSERDPDVLIGDRRKPDDWDELTRVEKLDFIAGRILAEDRRALNIRTLYRLKLTGILSVSQYERRLAKEVYQRRVPTHLERQMDADGVIDSMDEALFWQRTYLGAQKRYWKHQVLDEQEFGAKRAQ